MDHAVTVKDLLVVGLGGFGFLGICSLIIWFISSIDFSK